MWNFDIISFVKPQGCELAPGFKPKTYQSEQSVFTTEPSNLCIEGLSIFVLIVKKKIIFLHDLKFTLCAF